MTPMIDIKCPGCGKAFRFKDGVNVQAFAGKKIKCPACAAFLDIPSNAETPTPATAITSPQEKGEKQRLEEEERVRREEARQQADAADGENLTPHAAVPAETPAATAGAPSAMMRPFGVGEGRKIIVALAVGAVLGAAITAAVAWALSSANSARYRGQADLYHRGLMAERLRLMDQCKIAVALDNDPDYQSAVEDAITAANTEKANLRAHITRFAEIEHEEYNRQIQKAIVARQAAARKAGVPNISLEDAERALEKFDHEHIGIAQELGYKVGEWK